MFRSDPKFPLRASLMAPQTTTVSHQHEFTECIFIIEGRGLHQCGERVPVSIKRGDVLVIPPGGLHAYVEVEALALINLLFDASRLPSMLLELYSHPAYKKLFMRDVTHYWNRDFPFFTPAAEDFAELEIFALRLARLGNMAGKHCYKLGLFMVLLSLLCDARKVEAQDDIEVPLDIPKLTAFLERNFQREVYLDELTGLAAMSRSTLLRHFRAALGVTPMEYLRELRLRHAAELLLNTTLSPQKIADRSGFPTLAYFFRIFKIKYGDSPQVYRNRKKAASSASRY